MFLRPSEISVPKVLYINFLQCSHWYIHVLWLLQSALAAGCKAFLPPLLTSSRLNFPPQSFITILLSPQGPCWCCRSSRIFSDSPVQIANRQGPEGKIHLEAGGSSAGWWRWKASRPENESGRSSPGISSCCEASPGEERMQGLTYLSPFFLLNFQVKYLGSSI